jgi:hypothetical protein
MSSINKYVDFVSDEDFLEAVNHVVGAYSLEEKSVPEDDIINILEKSKNTTDEFKAIFDVVTKQKTFENWRIAELERQEDKTINNKIGEFHQILLGKVNGWVDLGIGDSTQIDLKNEDNTIFIELKNKHNTMNSSSSKTCREKLENVLKDYPNAITYWAFIVSNKYKSEEKIWKYKKIENPQIRIITGKKVYELITGDPNALEKVYYAIPKAIEDLLGTKYKSLDKEQMEIINEYGDFLFSKD